MCPPASPSERSSKNWPEYQLTKKLNIRDIDILLRLVFMLLLRSNSKEGSLVTEANVIVMLIWDSGAVNNTFTNLRSRNSIKKDIILMVFRTDQYLSCIKGLSKM